MTLMALSLCIGLLIDDAIVVRENIVRHIRMGKAPRRAALEGTQEVGLAVFATTLSIVAVFVPIAFMHGIIGKFFYAFGMTVAVSVLLSLFVSFTLDPMLSAVWHDPPGRPRHLPAVGRVLAAFDRGYERLAAVYARLLGWSLDRRKTTLAIALASLVVALPLFAVVGTEFVPRSDDSFITLRLTLPVGSSLAYADQRVRDVEQRLRAFPEIDAVETQVGTDEGHNTAQLNVSLVDRSRRARSQADLEAAMRKAIAVVPGVKLAVGWDYPIKISLLGNDDAQMAAADRCAAPQGGAHQRHARRRELDQGGHAERSGAARCRPGRRDRHDACPAGRLAARAHRRRELGLLAGARRPELRGRDPGAARRRAVTDDVANLGLVTGRTLVDGAPEVLPLHAIAAVQPAVNPENIRRQNLQRRVALFANVDGRPTGDVGNEVDALVKGETLPPGMRFELNGDFEQQQESAAAMLSVRGAGGHLHLHRAGLAVRQLPAAHRHHGLAAAVGRRRRAGAAADAHHAEHLLDDRHRLPDGPGHEERHPAGGFRQPRPARGPARCARRCWPPAASACARS